MVRREILRRVGFRQPLKHSSPASSVRNCLGRAFVLECREFPGRPLVSTAVLQPLANNGIHRNMLEHLFLTELKPAGPAILLIEQLTSAP